MELTNEQRRCMGLEETAPSWERVPFCHNDVLYFDGDIIRKWVIDRQNYFAEYSYHIQTSHDRTKLCSKTGKGKEKNLNQANLQRMGSEGVYFSFEKGGFYLANRTNQRTYYSSGTAGLSAMTEEEFAAFLDRWVAETDEEEQKRVQEFATAKRRHCKYREGDFFRFRLDRTHYGYGRILLDVEKRRKEGAKDWNILMGRALIVKVYHIVTKDPAMQAAELVKYAACPAQYIMDNRFYYGEYEIIGNAPLEEEHDYPILYGQSISARDRDKLLLQIGPLYRELPLAGRSVIPGTSLNNGISFALWEGKRMLKACIAAGSNAPYWERDASFACSDLRNPINRGLLEQVLAQFGVREETYFG